MLSVILSGVVVSILTEILKKKKKKDKPKTMFTLLMLSIVVSLLMMFILDMLFFPTLGWVLIFAGAFYAYVLRNVKGK